MNDKAAILIPGNGQYFSSRKKTNFKIHPFRSKIYEFINKAGLYCDYIGYDDLNKNTLSNYKFLFILNIEGLGSFQKKIIEEFVNTGNDLIISYKTNLFENGKVGIAAFGNSRQNKIVFGQQETDYHIINISNLFYKINRKYLKNSLPLGKLLTLPVLKIKADKNTKILARWKSSNLPALVVNDSRPGRIIYFSGILAGAEPAFLEYILSLVKPENFVPLPLIPYDKRCCVTIFHDYEREYAEPDCGECSDKGLNAMLESERKYNIKATFNIVAKICLSNPESIRRIIKDGHEIASHTYGHEIPSGTSYDKLSDSIDSSLEVFKREFDIDIKGFRSPESRWSPDLINILDKYNFSWDAEDEDASLPYHLVSAKKMNLMRMPITCDDFAYITDKMHPTDMLKKLKNTVEEGIKNRGFVALGFHPRIQGMDKARLKVFEEFLSYLSSRDGLSVMTFGEACDWWSKKANLILQSRTEVSS